MTKASFLLIALLIASALAWPAGQALAQTGGYTGCGGVDSPPVSNPTYEQTVIELVNTQRLNNGGLPPLKRVDSLDQAARYHAIDMAQDRYFYHDTYDRNPNRQLVEICGTSQRLETYYPDWLAMGENIAGGQESPQEAVVGWMGSSGHRANILSSNAYEVGVGYYPGGVYGTVWVLDFGRRESVYPLVINREAKAVASRDVSLYLYGEGTWSEMRLRNDNDAWSAWQPFQKEVTWTLKQQNGERTVWVELRQGTQTLTTSDTIEYTGSVSSGTTVRIYMPGIFR
jgi:uncharacterized protein YkwD